MTRETARVLSLMATDPHRAWNQSDLGHVNTRLALCKRKLMKFARFDSDGWHYRLTDAGRKAAAEMEAQRPQEPTP